MDRAYISRTISIAQYLQQAKLNSRTGLPNNTMDKRLPAEEDQSRENESQLVDHDPSRTKSCPKPPPSRYDEQNKRLKCSASQPPRSTDDTCNRKRH